MDHKTHMEKLDQLYELAIKTENINAALLVLDNMIMSCSIEASMKKGEKE